jgi:hypothetical protein
MFECVSKYIGRAWSCNSALADRQFDPSCAVPPSASVGMRAIARTGMAPPKRAVLSGLSMSGGGDRTGWLRRQDANFRIRSPWCWSRPETFFGKEAARQLYSRCAMFGFSASSCVLAEFDSEMQWCETCRPSQPGPVSMGALSFAAMFYWVPSPMRGSRPPLRNGQTDARRDS